MATKAQLAPEAKPIVEPQIRRPTLNQLQHIVYQNSVQYTQPVTASCWQAMVAISDRTPKTMNLITNVLLAMDEGDPMKIAKWSLNFEREAFHESASKEAYDQEMDQKILEFFKRRKGNEPIVKSLTDSYEDMGAEHIKRQSQQVSDAAGARARSLLSLIPRQKGAGNVIESLATRRKPVFLCKEPECEFSTTNYITNQALQQHIYEEHTKSREDPLKFAQENLALALGLEPDGSIKREPDTGAAENLVMPSSRVSKSPPVPSTIASDRTKGDKAHRSSLFADYGKRNQPQQIATRGVRDGRIIRPSTTNKPSLRDKQANLSSRGFER
ncbi:hypothetical protein FOVSG1_003330 [Fusarium oxysporum f. sp. vasinfectum]